MNIRVLPTSMVVKPLSISQLVLLYIQQHQAALYYDVAVYGYQLYNQRDCPIEWPAWSPEVMSVDFFPCDHLKLVSYKTQPTSLEGILQKNYQS